MNIHTFSQFDFRIINETNIKIYFLKIFFFQISKEEFCEYFGKDSYPENKGIKTNLSFDECFEKVNELFSDNQDNLINKITKIKTTYIHKNSQIPLIGSNVFGIVDRNTNILEVKPITGCNLKCIYCSLSEGQYDLFQREFVLDSDYLIEEIEKIIEYKNDDNFYEIHIGTHGEPTLFYDLEYFLEKVSKIKQVNRISINTNAVLLDENYIEKLVKAGLNRFNISINSLDENSKKISGEKFYNSQKIMKNILFIDSLIKSKKYPFLEMTLAPVLMKNINSSDVENIIKWVVDNKISCRIGIQNYLKYRTGQNVDKVIDFNKFFSILKEWEEKYKIKLILSEEDFFITKTKPLEKPFRVDDEFFVEIITKGRRKNEYLCVIKNRVVTIKSDSALKGRVKIKITRTKHNIFDAIHIKKNKRCCKI